MYGMYRFIKRSFERSFEYISGAIFSSQPWKYVGSYLVVNLTPSDASMILMLWGLLTSAAKLFQGTCLIYTILIIC